MLSVITINWLLEDSGVKKLYYNDCDVVKHFPRLGKLILKMHNGCDLIQGLKL